MSLIGRSVPVALATLLILAATGASRPVTPPSHTAQAEQRRIHAHFDSVLAELGLRDVRSLTAPQRGERARLVETLAAYNARAVFPHNYDFPDQPTPYFVDRQTGTLCAVAHLLESTGRRDIVDRVARANNNVWVTQLAGDSALATWLDQHGITLAEAARIQVPYVSSAEQTMIVTVVAGAPIALVGSLATGIWNATGNADGHRRSGLVVGIASGVALSAIGGMLMAEEQAANKARTIGGTSAAIGGISVALAFRGLQRRGRVLAAKRDAKDELDRRRAEPRASVVPLIAIGRTPSAGAAMTIRF